MRIEKGKVLRFTFGKKVLDAGGGKNPFPGATTFDIQGGHITGDLCEPWPFDDNSYDFIICAQTLEDIRDPIFACREMARVGKAGYIEVPSWKLELSTGHDEMLLGNRELSHGIGYPHHRWIIEKEGNTLIFTFKFSYPYFLEGFKQPTIESEEDLYLPFFWEGSFQAIEQHLLDPKEVELWYRHLGVL